MEKISHYCQKCRAANDLGEAICRRCGTRLMLVVFPNSLKYDSNYVPSYYEDHLLERVSSLELRLTQITEQLALVYEFVAREMKSFHKDRRFIQSFFETLKKNNPEFAEILNKEMSALFEEKTSKLEVKTRQEEILQEVLRYESGGQTEIFTHLVKEAIKLLEQKEEKQAFKTLQGALNLSPENVPLLVFAGEKLFRADRFSDARKFLEKAFLLAPQNEKILLLLGAIYADEAETERARKLLSVLANNSGRKFCVNFIWGMLAAFEANWTESLAAFKQSSENSVNQASPEIEYLIGCVYFELQNYTQAIQYLQKAAALDAKFADAWFMQSVVYNFLGDFETAENAMGAAFESKEAGAQCMEFLKNKKAGLVTALPFTHFKKIKKNILTGGSRRLNNFLHREIFKSDE